MNNSSSFFSFIIFLGICFAILPASTKTKFLKNIEMSFDLKNGSLVDSYNKNESITDTSGSSSSENYHSNEAKEYFNEICLKTESGKIFTETKEKTEDVKIYVSGYCPEYMMSELSRIVGELNDLIVPIELEIVSDKSQANTFLYLGSANGFKQVYSEVKDKNISNTAGYFLVKSNKSYLYVNMVELGDNIVAQKATLREELTQSLGFYNDSWKYPNSVFYQGWVTNTEYSDLDKEIIQMLYNE